MFIKKNKIHVQPSIPQPSIPTTNNIIKDIGQTIVQGIAFGTGSSLGNRVVAAIFDSSKSNTSNPCKDLFTSFEKCLNNDTTDNTICKDLFEQFKKCEEKN